MAKVAFTAARVMKFKCPTDKAQAFLWDSIAPGLGLRCTPLGSPSYVFQGRYQDKTIRLTIGSPTVWSIPEAQDKARELQRLIDIGRDPRVVKAEQKAKDKAHSDAEKLNAVTLGEIWAEYIQERRPFWGDAHYKSHLEKADAGGRPSKRRGMTDKLTKPGPLASLMPLALKDLESTIIESWAAKEGKDRPSSARLAWRLLTVFLNWCSEQPMYANAIPLRNPAKTKKTREALGKQGVKDDVLTREQLSAWFSAVQHIPNRVISAYLQVMLLTGARPTEVLDLQWKDINYQWKGLTIRDKVEGERVIPLTPYVWHLLAALPRRNEWVFSSASAKGGRIVIARNNHHDACAVAGIDGLTVHGLRRSFKSLTEWLEIPAGVVAQIMGHKPSATAEKHYTVRPLDLLRVHHERIEAWILEQAGIVFDAKAAPGALRVVQAA